ncbi:MAG: hypothetical protein U5R31_15105 [Acidimicrobiia bacterium]|nr:hypothetical protein [Acidimicrobiia bacterium]
MLLGLTGFAISQPLLSVLGSSPTIFVFHRVTGWTLVWLALAIALVPPLVLWTVGLGLTRLDRRVGRWYHLGVAGVLVALALIQGAKELGVDGTTVLVLVAGVGAAGFGYAYWRVAAVGTWLRYTSPLPLVAVALFLVASPTSDLLRAPAAGPADAATASGEPPPVVMVMLDELPTLSLLDEDGGIDPVRFPTSPGSPTTRPGTATSATQGPCADVAVPSMLTGRAPRRREPRCGPRTPRIPLHAPGAEPRPHGLRVPDVPVRPRVL